MATHPGSQQNAQPLTVDHLNQQWANYGPPKVFMWPTKLKFYESLHSEKLQNLKKISRKMFVLFASAYICEQTFSIMKGPCTEKFAHPWSKWSIVCPNGHLIRVRQTINYMIGCVCI
ncbi:hypothetical protein OTU49_008678 [Cherax quadricarinatus]|uniref:HAT C-terminal dimerisation domain-containing protein n=1 Tax=Cherax quadricarinatus TaxID=27406 RepID=A0AAW0WBW0_CHEQU